MPNNATMSIYGLWVHDNDIFNQLNLPDDVDGDLVVAKILFDCFDLEILYPDWDFMNAAIGIWSAAELPTWERIDKLQYLEYNPIENYDRMESEASGKDRNLDRKRTTSDSEKSSGVSHTSQENSENTSNSENNVSNSAHNVTGYNTNTPVTDNTDQSSQSGSRSGSTSGSATANASSSTESSKDGTDNTTEGEQENIVRNLRIHGNIGVLTSQKMILEELNMSPQINIINYIVESFKRRFCIMVY